MKKRVYLAATALGAGMLLLTGCGDDGKKEASVDGTEAAEEAAFDFKGSEYVTLGEYKNLAVRYPVPVISDEDVELEVEYLLDENTEYNEISDRSVEDGDYISIDFAGTIDGKEFEGGSETGYEFTLGEGEFLEEFEKNLIGKNKGETATFSITYPEGYDDDLTGKTAEFNVTINSISEIVVPEYNDAFVKEKAGYDTVQEYEKALREELIALAEQDSVDTAGEDALQAAISNATIKGYPQALYDACHDSTMKEYQEYADMLDMEISDFIGSDEELDNEVLNWVNEILVSQAIAEKEGFEITDDGYEEDAKALAQEYEYDSLDEFIADYGDVFVKSNVLRARAVAFLYENADVEEVSEDEYYGGGDDLESLEEAGTEVAL